MQKIAFLVSIILLAACQSKKEERVDAAVSCSKDSTATGSKFKMYEMSEMSLLMEQMYVDNQRLKDRIQKGDTIGEFPNHFLKIHKAVMTDDKENDVFFKEQAANFIHAQEMIYKDPKNAKEHFNKGVDACLRCHQVKCAGPIPRIKKLYID
jgi:cytochrome c553